MEEVNIKYLDIEELKPYENNPRFNDEAVEMVKNSIKEFGFKVPIIIDKENVIIAGHTRLKAAKELGLSKIPTIKADDLTEEQAKAFRIVDNKVSELSEWNFELLESELFELEEINFDMDRFGFEDIEVRSYEIEEDEDFEIKPPEEPRTKIGDIYKLGRHFLMCGDSTKEEDVLRLTNGNVMDILITDPPYNVDYEGKTEDALKIQNDKMKDDDFREFLKDAFKAADAVLKSGGVFYIWHADSEGYAFRGACNDVGWQIRQCLIWNKNSMVMGRQDYHWKHEPCLYGWKDGAAHLWASDRRQTTILDFDRPNRNAEHPTMKPVKLFDYQIQNNTNPGDKVLDLFGGSGTTLIACEQNDRESYLMELDPKYCDVIINRWENLTGETAKKIG